MKSVFQIDIVSTFNIHRHTYTSGTPFFSLLRLFPFCFIFFFNFNHKRPWSVYNLWTVQNSCKLKMEWIWNGTKNCYMYDKRWRDMERREDKWKKRQNQSLRNKKRIQKEPIQITHIFLNLHHLFFTKMWTWLMIW